MGAFKSKDSKNLNSTEGVRNFDEHLKYLKARVDRVNITGLKRTHDDYVRRSILNLFEANTVMEMFNAIEASSENITDLGIFKDYHIKLDVSKGPNATPNGYEVTFIGTELLRIGGALTTELNKNEGVVRADAYAPNLFGRGEKININGSYGHSNTTDINITLSKPFYHTRIGDYKPLTSLNLFRHSASFPWSKYKTQELGAQLDFSFRFPGQILHKLQYEFAMKEIFTLGKQVPMAIRLHSGPHLVSLVRYIAMYDQRDNNVYPTKGICAHMTNELAGIKGGNVGYVMHTAHCEMNVPLMAGISAQLCCRYGIIGRGKNHPEIPINNLFVLGGPLSLRGFNIGGASAQENGCAIGAHTYWATGLHLWAPLPFNSHFSTFGNLFRTHLFYNLGNCDSFSMDNVRSAAGVGLAFRLAGQARIEFNYCVPLNHSKDNHTKKGFQFGIGYEFI